MGHHKSKYIYGLLTIFLIVLSAFSACRRETVPLDRNIPPETYITAAPPETLDVEFRVHVYWHGVDKDGKVEKYMIYISDTVKTLRPDEEPDIDITDWNPAIRGSDYEKGTITTRTDSIIIFKGYDERLGTMVNRQAIHVVAIDDGGKMDPTPARLQFKARVKGLPEVKYFVDVGEGLKEYNHQQIDTISMFTPFTIRFFATSINGNITGYRWLYGNEIFPIGSKWYIPSIDPPETVTVSISNKGSEKQPSGNFTFRAIARDEAGALSEANSITGEGLCQIVINHDPDTRIIGGECYYVPQSTGVLESLIVDFNDEFPDTLPYNSYLRLDYVGWDDPKDKETLEFKDPPLPIKFQFRYKRWHYNLEGMIVGVREAQWYPIEPEDTNPGADLEDPYRDQDSTSIRVGSYDYMFQVRSYDEQIRPDGTPDTVYFFGSYKPTIDYVEFWYENLVGQQIKIEGDTIYIGWGPRVYGGDTVNVYRVEPSSLGFDKIYKLILKADGHDDYRDPPGSDIKEWFYNIYDPDYDYNYKNENESLVATELAHPIYLFFTFPSYEEAFSDSLVKNPPPYFGEQVLTLIGGDKAPEDVFYEMIRGKSPMFDEYGNRIPVPGGLWVTQKFTGSQDSRKDVVYKRFYMKLVY